MSQRNHGDAALRAWVVVALLGAPAAHADLTEVRARGSLRVITHVDPASPEFSGPDPARPGIDIEILKGFANLNKLKIEIVDVSGGPDLRVAALLEGKGDVVAGRLATTSERANKIAFSAEIFPLRYTIVSRDPSLPIPERQASGR